MGRELALSSESIAIDPEEIYKIYKEIAHFTIIPTLHEIYGQYCTVVDSRMIDLQRKMYLDDYESGSGNIPDFIKHDILGYIGIPINMSPEEIAEVLNRAGLTYWLRGLQQSPLREVW